MAIEIELMLFRTTDGPRGFGYTFNSADFQGTTDARSGLTLNGLAANLYASLEELVPFPSEQKLELSVRNGARKINGKCPFVLYCSVFDSGDEQNNLEKLARRIKPIRKKDLRDLVIRINEILSMRIKDEFLDTETADKIRAYLSNFQYTP